MKKKLLFIATLLLVVSLTACAKKDVQGNVLMDQLASDNKFHYTNKDLGFSVDFPEEFLHYQTQRKKMDNYQEVEFFVPTSDRKYPQDIQSYGKYLMVKIFNKEKYVEEDGFVNLGKNNENVYVGVFWNSVPSDWQDKWNDNMESEIISSFKTK